MSAPMFDGTPMTKREVLIARDKFVMGVHWMYQRKLVPSEAWPGDDVIRDAAAELYPLPMVTRPRVVTDPHAEFLQWSTQPGALHRLIVLKGVSETEWTQYPDRSVLAQAYPSPERVAIWADLLANPTEEVEDDERDAAIERDRYYNADGYAVWEDNR